MFKFKPDPTFVATVLLSMPGVAQPHPVTMTFKHKSKAQLLALFAKADSQTDGELIQQIVDGWDMVDEGGQRVDFTPRNMGLLLNNYPPAAMEILVAYKRELLEAKTKN
jgi:Phage tail assembly chaperone